MNQKPKHILSFTVWITWVFQTSSAAAVPVQATSAFNWINLMFGLLIAVILLLVVKVRNNAKVLGKLRNELKYLSRTDDLTQFFNRRYLEKRLYEIFERHLRSKSSNSVLLMIGIDGFKDLLNNSGQSAGDLVVHTTAGLIQERVRNTDLCGRFAEDTFLVLLRDTKQEPAKKLAEELRLKLQETVILYGQQKIYITGSMGLAAYSTRMVSCRDWIQQADQALNRAKQLGGSQTTVY